ncbi:universal stress protein [Actinomadura rayongensis]|uniref:Universal stress protein n=1 Tax=Actinomadura rayongensis TaxID=1429076 RepID=A0A6I4W7R3_9ACTN|nr:universal stress protein [Actinomadura rayongensis]
MATPITVGVDGSANARQALDWAADEARRHGRPLLLLHACRALLRDGTLTDLDYERLDEDRTALLEDARQYVLKQAPDADVTTELAASEPDDALVDASARAGLLAVGARGAGGFAELLFGSVALHVAGHARCPVLAVPAGAAHPADAPPEVLVGVDTAHRQDAVLGWAFEEASLRGARLTALHAVSVDQGSPRLRDIADRDLAEALMGWSDRYPDVVVRPVVADSGAARALVLASGESALAVLGTRGRVGRVGHAVLHHARCPVVLVPVTG